MASGEAWRRYVIITEWRPWVGNGWGSWRPHPTGGRVLTDEKEAKEQLAVEQIRDKAFAVAKRKSFRSRLFHVGAEIKGASSEETGRRN